jgi:hypothetical protein
VITVALECGTLSRCKECEGSHVVVECSRIFFFRIASILGPGFVASAMPARRQGMRPRGQRPMVFPALRCSLACDRGPADFSFSFQIRKLMPLVTWMVR